MQYVNFKAFLELFLFLFCVYSASADAIHTKLSCILFLVNMKNSFFSDQNACRNISQGGVVDCHGLVLFAWESKNNSSRNLFLVSPEESVEDFLYNLIMMADVRTYFFLFHNAHDLM